MARRALLITLILCLSALSSPLPAGELAGVTLPDTAEAGDADLLLNGMALRSKAIFKVYVAGLYLPEKSNGAPEVLAADTPRKLVMHWVRSVGKKKICDGWYEGLELNTTDPPEELKGQFDTLCGFMEDSKTGDQFSFTYLPEEGTEVRVKGAKKGTIPGKAFADALFACWIGEKPGPGEDFREALMGNS